MFFKKKPDSETIPEAWDERTMMYLKDRDRLEVQITSATKRKGFGAFGDGSGVFEEMKEPEGYEISGIITYPRYMLVEISFEQTAHFGFWCYNLYDRGGHMHRRKIPFIQIGVSDSDWKIRES